MPSKVPQLTHGLVEVLSDDPTVCPWCALEVLHGSFIIIKELSEARSFLLGDDIGTTCEGWTKQSP